MYTQEIPMHVKTIALAVALLLVPLTAGAHNVVKGPNGGQVIDDGGSHIEFTTKADEIVIYLSDNADAPVSSAKASGRVIIQDIGKTSNAELAPSEPNVLSCKLAGPLSAGAKIAVTIKLGDGRDVKARFVLR
jgi:hypothetical protein